jgi:hypothetical protein
MDRSFESGALLGHVYTLQDGLPVRLRLARGSDAPAIRTLLERHGGTDDLEPARLVYFDPRRRFVLCAAGLVDGTEMLLGVGAISLGATDPDLLLVADGCPEEVAGLLHRALVATAAAHAA